jgi:hypothetical protein
MEYVLPAAFAKPFAMSQTEYVWDQGLHPCFDLSTVIKQIIHIRYYQTWLVGKSPIYRLFSN